MSMFRRKKDDGRIRMMCHECGKRLKLPSDQPGRVFRCPICSTTLVAPLETDAKGGGKGDSSQAALEEMPSVFDRSSSPPKRGRKASEWRPQVKEAEENKSIERLIRFANRENERVRDVAVSVLNDPAATSEQKTRRLMSLRTEKNQRLRAEIDKLVENLDDDLRRFSRGPDVRKAEARARLDKKRAEKEGFLLFLRIIYGLRLADTRPEETGIE